MDKGIIKINELNKKIETLIEEVSEIEKIEFEKSHEKRKVENNINSLNLFRKNDNKELEELKESEKNLKKTLFKKILIIVLSTFVINAVLFGVFFNLLNTINILLIMGTNLITFPMSIANGELFTGYRATKKKLKNNKILELENKVKEKDLEIEKNKQMETKLRSQLDKLLEEKLSLLDNINSLNDEKLEIEKIRNKVIKEFIENNEQLDNLLNNEYGKKLMLKK